MSQRSLPEVKLEPIDEYDLPELRNWRNDRKIYRWCRQCEPISIAHHEAWFKNLSGNDKLKMYAVKSGSELVGCGGLTSIDWVNRRAEVSLFIGPEFQRTGYGEAAGRRLLNVAFNVFNLNCVWGESFPDSPALSLFKRIGFHYEGERRSFYYRDGKYVSASLWSILRSEYA